MSRLDVLIILINFSPKLFLHCSYFLAISEAQCSYKVCSYKKKEYLMHSEVHQNNIIHEDKLIK